MKKIVVLLALAALTFSSYAAPSIKADKDVYLDLMQHAVEAYSPERVDDYIRRVDAEGITEHGFARLTSNLGVLIAHGRHTEMTDTFLKMMDICVREVPVVLQNKHKGTAGNDFAVKELCLCILEVEKAGFVPKARTDAWRKGLSDMKATDIYSVQPPLHDDRARNWCVFGAASECARLYAGIGGERSYADLYLYDQLDWFDENGMYMDPHQPIVYDLVTRLQYMAALYCGYDGPARSMIESQLLKSAELTLQMQSVTGEIPFGGRSNQFLHNEGFFAAVCEYYATWMKERGDMQMARRFKAAACRAVASLAYWTDQKPLRHIKNRYPTETSYGCEDYAYFDKYMVTLGSWAYLAYLFADDSIIPASKPEHASTFVTSAPFHRIMMNAGGYTVQFDTDADRPYDSNGIGRIQKCGAPPILALSSPCPSETPNYTLDLPVKGPLAIAPLWDKYELVSAKTGKVVLTDGKSLWTNKLSSKGLEMTVKGSGVQTLTLPVLVFDGESETEVSCDGHSLTVKFKGSTCRYVTDGIIEDTGETYANRNGHLRRYDAKGEGKLTVSAVIE